MDTHNDEWSGRKFLKIISAVSAVTVLNPFYSLASPGENNIVITRE